MLDQNNYSAQKARHDHDEEVREDKEQATTPEKNCWNCGYKEEIPGDAQIKCMRLFADVKPPKAKSPKPRWYSFPLNFDPTWQLEQCKGWADQRDPTHTRQGNPLQDVLSILGRR